MVAVPLIVGVGSGFTVTAVVTPVVVPHALVAVMVYTPALKLLTPNDAGF
jgi:hypothetical protein